MAILPRTRKRVRAIPRAPDGSAFQKCHICGVAVAISLADMHACQSTKKVKRFKGIRGRPKVKEERFSDQPRSAFCFFMEEFKTCESGDPIKIDRKGFKAWKNMSMKERQPYVRKAELVNYHYDKALRDEADKMSKDPTCHEDSEDNEDDDFDSWRTYVTKDEAATFKKFDPDLPCWEDCSGSGWHTYEDCPWLEDCSGSGWHTYVSNEETEE